MTDGAAAQAREPRPQVFRSPVAVVVWWLWVLFAAGNLIDLAVQGRDRTSGIAAAILVLVTGLAYITAQRPRIIAAAGGLTVRNPLRDHRITWGSVTKVDASDLIRVHCEWPLGGADGEGGAPATGRRVVHAWAVHSSRRRQAIAQLRAAGRGDRQARRYGGAGYAAQAEPVPAGGADQAGQVVRALSERAVQEAGSSAAVPPTATWCWPGITAVVIPVIAVLLVAFV